MTFFDGNSTDGTLDVIKDFQKYHPHGKKIILVEGMDPGDVSGEGKDAYTRMFNECMWTLPTDLAFFNHPDFIPMNPEVLATMNRDGVAYSVHMDSFGGDPDGQLYKINGRDPAWKCIYRLRNPNLGGHYFGAYGAWNEDVYFEALTGEAHDHYGSDFRHYPYAVVSSGLLVNHYSDVRTRQRRLERMLKVLANQGHPAERLMDIANKHPRVTLQDGKDLIGSPFTFEPATYPPIFKTWKETLNVHA